MVTTKKINKRYRKGNKKNSKWCIRKKNPSNTKEGNIGGIEEQKRYDIGNEYHNGRKKSFFISNHFKCKWVKLTN